MANRYASSRFISNRRELIGSLREVWSIKMLKNEPAHLFLRWISQHLATLVFVRNSPRYQQQQNISILRLGVPLEKRSVANKKRGRGMPAGGG